MQDGFEKAMAGVDRLWLCGRVRLGLFGEIVRMGARTNGPSELDTKTES